MGVFEGEGVAVVVSVGTGVRVAGSSVSVASKVAEGSQVGNGVVIGVTDRETAVITFSSGGRLPLHQDKPRITTMPRTAVP